MKKIINIAFLLFFLVAISACSSRSNNATDIENPQRYYGAVNKSLEVPAPGFLVNTSYVIKKITLLNAPTHGTLTMQLNGSFTYIPNKGYIGEDTFDYMIATSQGDSKSLTMTLHIYDNIDYNPIQVVTQRNPASGLKHPGILLNAKEIKAISAGLLSGDTTKDDTFKNMQGSTRGRWSSNKWKLESYDIKGESDWNARLKEAGAGAIRYALAWIMKRDATSEKYAIDILNEWAKAKSFTPDPNDNLKHHRLYGGMWFGYLAHAAELLIYSDTSWPKSEQDAFKKTLKNIYLPVFNEDRASAFNGNWDLAATWSALSFAVLLDDKALFDENIERLKSGKTNARIEHYILPNGQNAETARDQVHAQMGILFLALSAQIAWSQGIDLYEYKGRSIGKAYEYQALYNLGEDNVSFQFWPNPVHSGGSDIQAKAMTPSNISRELDPIYEMVYHHYKSYRNIELPHVKNVLENNTRDEGAWARGSNWNTVSYYDLNLSLEAPLRGAKTPVDTSIDISLPNTLILLDAGLNSIEDGAEQYISTTGDVYVADYKLAQNGSKGAVANRNISNTVDDKLYLTYRSNDGNLNYICNITNVKNGKYKVRLHFAELFEEEINKRVFHIEIEGNKVASNVDIFSQVGKDSAYVVDYDTQVNDGILNIDLIQVTGKTMLQGLEVTKVQ